MQPEQGRVARTVAHVELPTGKASLLEYFWDEPLDVVGPPATSYRVDYALLPRHRRNGSVGFPARWPEHDLRTIGQIFLLPPEQRMRARGSFERNSSVVCEIDPSLVNSCLDTEISWTAPKLQACLDVVSGTIRNAMMRIRDELLEPNLATERMCSALMVQIAIDLGRYCSKLQAGESAGGLASWRLQLIDERIAQRGSPPKLSELAELCNMSERHLTRGFRESRGCSLRNYISVRQLDYAKLLIAEGVSIKEIAHRIGFTAPSNFSSAFHRMTGMTPRHYRASIVRQKLVGEEVFASS